MGERSLGHVGHHQILCVYEIKLVIMGRRTNSCEINVVSYLVVYTVLYYGGGRYGDPNSNCIQEKKTFQKVS